MEICAPSVTSVFWTVHQLERGQEGGAHAPGGLGGLSPAQLFCRRRESPRASPGTARLGLLPPREPGH